MNSCHNHGYQGWDATAVTQDCQEEQFISVHSSFTSYLFLLRSKSPLLCPTFCDVGSGFCKLCFSFACWLLVSVCLLGGGPLGRLQGLRWKERLSFLPPSLFLFVLCPVLVLGLLSGAGLLAFPVALGCSEGSPQPLLQHPQNGWCVLIIATPSPNWGNSGI